MWKRSFCGRSLRSHRKIPIESSFFAPPSGRHRACSYKFLPSNWSSALSILVHSKKNWPCRCGKGHFVADLYPHLGEKPEFRSFLASDSGWLSYSKNTIVVSFWSSFLRLIEQLKNLSRLVKVVTWWPIFTITSKYCFLKLFFAPLSGRHRAYSYKFLPSNCSSVLSFRI